MTSLTMNLIRTDEIFERISISLRSQSGASSSPQNLKRYAIDLGGGQLNKQNVRKHHKTWHKRRPAEEEGIVVPFCGNGKRKRDGDVATTGKGESKASAIK
ncbi:hypothetical protein GR268_47550, partial [Rhizobium leguminosarum]|nr:hypothetical protein [Rhizobium leguminosarum]